LENEKRGWLVMLKVVILCSWDEDGDILHKAVIDDQYVYYREPCNNHAVGISCGSDEVIQLPLEMTSKSEWDKESYLVEEAVEELQITEEELLNKYELYFINSWEGARIFKANQKEKIANALISKPIMWCDEYQL